MKRFLSEFKISVALKDRKLTKEESIDLLRSIVKMGYYKIIGEKISRMWLNIYILPKIKCIYPELNDGL